MSDQRHEHPWILAVLVILLTVAALIGPFLMWDGGLIETETTYFVQQYLDSRTVVRKVFDPHANDLKTYQARELSYSVDLIDAYIFKGLLANGIVLLMPFSNAAAALLTVAVFLWGMRRTAPHVGLATTALIVLVYLTNFVFMVTTGMFYRSAKPLLAPTLLAALFYVQYAVNRRSPTSFVAVLAFGCVLSLLDRQGFFYTFVLLAALIVVVVFRRVGGNLLSAAVAAICLMTLYNIVIAPWIIHQVNGYWPTLDYQRVPLQALTADPLRLLMQAGELVWQSARVLIGSFPLWLYVGAAAVALAMIARHASTASPARYVLPVLLICGAAASQILMVSLMIVRHPAVYEWPDHRVWYYPLPFQAMLLFGMALLVGHVSRGDRRRIAAINVVLGALVVANILAWRDHRDTLLRAPWFPTVYQQSAALKASLQQREAAPALDEAFRNFYDYLARRLPPP